MSEADDKLAAVRARREALAEAREARARLTPEEQLALEERALRDDEALDRLESEHGRIGAEIEAVRSDIGMVIVRRPHMAVYRRWQSTLQKDGSDPFLEEQKLVRPSVLHPSKEEFDAMVERQPFLLSRCASAVCELAGVRKQAIEKKY